MIDGRRTLGTATLRDQAQCTKVFMEKRPLNVFCQDVRRILVAGHLLQAEVLCSEPVLHPEVRRRKMADLT